jgi:hypothetical protein
MKLASYESDLMADVDTCISMVVVMLNQRFYGQT